MCGLLEEAFAAGAAGFSTGFMYAPGSIAPTDELLVLCRVVAKHGKIYTTHMGSYLADLVESIEEQVRLARYSDCRLQISHLQAVGASNWAQHKPALVAIEEAAQKGVNIAFDCYPYTAGSSVLTQLLPQRVLDGGTAAMLARLTDASQRTRICEELLANFVWRWTDVYISAAGSQANAWTVGHNLQEIADERGDVNMISFNQSEEILRLSLTHPLAIVISDAAPRATIQPPRTRDSHPWSMGGRYGVRCTRSGQSRDLRATGRSARRHTLCISKRHAPVRGRKRSRLTLR
jgi:dihydroorotase/N-acyl-D-amino-acid deacylase